MRDHAGTGCCRARAADARPGQAARRVLALATLLAAAVAATPARGDETPTFERDIKPLLARRCTVCHNPRKLADPDVSGGLALDTFDAVLAGTAEHRVVAPGKAAESELLRRLESDDEDERMPLLEKPLPPAQRELVRRWIEAGAPRGTAPAPSAAQEDPSQRRPRRIARALDVVLPVETKAPADVEGFGRGGPIQVVVKLGPLPPVSALAFRGDGRLLAAGTHGEVMVWDLVDARPALVLTDLPGAVHALAFSSDGKRLAVGAGLPARSGSVRVYSVPDGTLIHDFAGHDDVVFGLAFRPDGAQLASASFDQTVRLWNLALGRPDGLFAGHSDFVYDVAYTPDGQSLLTVSKDRTVKRLDVKTLKEARTYSGHNDDVLALAVEPSGRRFVTAGNEPQLRWWTLDSDKPALRIGGHGGPVHQAAFSADGKRLITAGGDSTVRLWDGATGSAQRTLPGPTEWQYAVALSADARLAAAGGWDGLLRVWDAGDGRLLGTLLQPPSDSPGRADWLVLVPAGYVAASDDLAGSIRWKVGGVEVDSQSPAAVFLKPDEAARALRGEAVPAPSFPQPK